MAPQLKFVYFPKPKDPGLFYWSSLSLLHQGANCGDGGGVSLELGTLGVSMGQVMGSLGEALPLSDGWASHWSLQSSQQELHPLNTL